MKRYSLLVALTTLSAVGCGVNAPSEVLPDSDDFKEDAIVSDDLPPHALTMPGEDRS
jgi:hypothetical protein